MATKKRPETRQRLPVRMARGKPSSTGQPRPTRPGLGDRLTEREQRFCIEYQHDFNATQAASRAGYSTPHKAGSDLLARPRIRAELDRRREAYADKVLLEGERIIEELSKIALSDVRELFDDCGRLKPPKDWSPELGARIQSIEVRTVKGQTQESVTEIAKIRFWDKVRALEILGRYRGLDTEQRATEDRGLASAGDAELIAIAVGAGHFRAIPAPMSGEIRGLVPAGPEGSSNGAGGAAPGTDK